MEYASSDYPAPPPPPPPGSPSPSAAWSRSDSAPAGRRRRLAAAARNPRFSSAALALLIGFASVFSAVLAWRASLATIDASRYESLAVQQQARREQILAEIRGVVSQDLRFLNIYREHVLAALELRSQAEAVRASNPLTADAFDLLAHARLNQARLLISLVVEPGAVSLDANGTPTYDEELVTTVLVDENAELRELATQRTPALAQRAATRGVALVGVAALVIAALFFLTIAQVSRARAPFRQVFLVAGALLVLSGTVGWLAVELVG